MTDSGGSDQGVSHLIDLVGKWEDLIALLTETPRDRGDIQDTLGVSRSTVYRSVKALEEHEIIERASGRYRTTLYGSLLLELYRDFDRNVATLSASRAAFTPFSPDIDLSLDFVFGADIFTVENDDQPGLRMVELAETCDEFYAMAGVHRPELLDPLHERITAGEVRAHIVMTADILEYLRTYAPEKVTAVLESGNLELFRLDDTYPWGMIMAKTNGETVVAVAVQADLNPANAVIINDSNRAVARFTEIFETHQERSTLVTAPES